MGYDVVTIGSGLGGLLSSVLLAKKGKKVLLLEQHNIPGGYCTSFKRNGFTFNIPSLFTNIREGELHSNLSGLGLFDSLDWLEIENFGKYIYPDLEIVLPANNADACRENFRSAFPSEKQAIDRVFSDMARLQKGLGTMSKDKKSVGEMLTFLSSLPKVISLSRKSYYEYLRGITGNERLISALSTLWGYAGLPSKKLSALVLLMISAECYGKPSYFPKDGCQAVSDFLASKLVEFGGEIRYRTKAAQLIIKDGKATGVKTGSGDLLEARAVISNADTRKTFFELAGRENLPQALAAKIDAHTPSPSCISLQIGTNLDLSRFDLKYGSVFYCESWEDSNLFFEKAQSGRLSPADESVVLGLQASSLLSERLAPKGMSTLHAVLFPFSPAFRDNFGMKNGERGEEYKAIKQELADILLRKIDKLVPGLSGSVVVKELSTPYTFERYTGATNGAMYDSVLSFDRKVERPSARTPIANLYLTGTKAYGGVGMSSALTGGINAAKAVLGK